MKPVDVDITPKREILESLHLSRIDFDGALEDALDALVGTPTSQLPAPRNIALTLRGQEFRLGEVAKIDVKFDLSEAGA